MDTMTSLLLTGVGAPGTEGTLYAIRKEIPKNLVVVGTDMKKQCAGSYLVDDFFSVPTPEDPSYVSTINQIVKKCNITAIVPQTTREAIAFAANRHRFTVPIMVSQGTALRRAVDKWTLILAVRPYVRVPHSYIFFDKESFLVGFNNLKSSRVIVKPRCSSGSRGVRIISTETEDLNTILQSKGSIPTIHVSHFLSILKKLPEPLKDGMIVQEYLPGDEYSVDVYCDRNNGVAAVPRLREKIINGISFETLVDMRKDLVIITRTICESLLLRYAIGLQFKLDERGDPALLECNPRIQGTMVAGVFTGCNIIGHAVADLLGRKSRSSKKPRKVSDVRYYRYWSGIGVVHGDPV